MTLYVDGEPVPFSAYITVFTESLIDHIVGFLNPYLDIHRREEHPK